MSDTVWQIIAMVIYFVAMIAIGFAAYYKTKNFEDYMLGGRELSPFVAALSAGAADMSGWLLMGLPGAIYMNGLVEGWIAVGLTVGAWLNWKVVAPRLRAYTEIAGDSITIPSFFGERLRDSTKLLRVVSGIIILVFFTFYVSSGMVAGGKFFEESFGLDYHAGMVMIAGIVVLYTLVGGFLAVSWTDTVQGTMMLAALILVPVVGIIHVGGFGELVTQVQAVKTVSDVDGSTVNLFSIVGGATVVGVVSSLAWGLGYVGQPHIIVRFMALRSPGEAKSARRIGIGWMILSVVGAIVTALVGIAEYKHNPELLHDPEAVFIGLGQLLFHPLVAGLMLAAILAAIMSTISSQLLVTSSALVEDVWNAFSTKAISDKKEVMLGRGAVLLISVIAAALAWPNSESILALVAFAWAGFGASFGPVVVLSLYWKKLTNWGALTGMIVGAVTVVVWKELSGGPGGIFDLYEILPGFCFNLLAAWIVSTVTYKPNAEMDSEFDETVAKVRSGV